MALRIRLAITGALVAVAAVALAGTGLGSAAMARLAGHGASAAAPPAYVDMSAQFRSDPRWGTAQGLIAPDPVAASAVVAAPVARVSVLDGSLPLGSVLPPPTSGQASFRDLNLSRAGMTGAPACSGAACGTDGCGFLAPGCALLDCGLLNPACGLGVPVGTCGILDPGCGFAGCGLFGSGCLGFDGEHALFERLRLDEILDSDRHFRFFDHHVFDHHVFDDRSHHHH
jgi:hypothetical protein